MGVRDIHAKLISAQSKADELSKTASSDEEDAIKLEVLYWDIDKLSEEFNRALNLHMVSLLKEEIENLHEKINSSDDDFEKCVLELKIKINNEVALYLTEKYSKG